MQANQIMLSINHTLQVLSQTLSQWFQTMVPQISSIRLTQDLVKKSDSQGSPTTF